MHVIWMRFKRRLLPVISLLMTAAFVLLLAGIPENAGIVGGMFVLVDAAAIAVLALAILVLALLTRQLPREYDTVMKALGLWVIVPVFAGYLLFFLIMFSMYKFYQSGFFQTVSAAQHGVAIELEDQQFYFFHCALSPYVATYKIDARWDQDLTFGLGAAEGLDPYYVDYLQGPLQSLSAQLEYVGEGEVSSRSAAIGVFHIPQGSHSVEIEGAAPFLLEVYSTEPLWLLDLLVAGNDNYLPFYADRFTRADFDEAARPLRPSSCPPPGVNIQ